MKLFKTLLFIVAMIVMPSLAGPGLADGAAKFVGNITTRGQVRSDFTELWNQITAENECKWASIEGTRGRYNWGGCDAAYNWAKNNGGHFKFHALVWGSQYPNWLNGLSADETKKAITAWFDAVAARYPDLEMIDVVNEAIKSGGNYHSGYGNGNNIIQALGGDNGNYEFVATAFKMARERWPDAILIYNDYNTVQWQKNEGIDLIQKLKKQGAPVDAYGLQAHDMMTQGGGQGGTGGGGGCLSINTLRSVLDEIWQKTETPMFISEYDIFTDNDQTQKQCYQEQITLFMENEHVAGITLWGYIYGATWNDGTSGIIKDGRDRAAMTWLKEYLSINKGVNTTGLPTGELTEIEPEPQTPFKGKPFDLTEKIQAEDFDNPGKGKGNNSFFVSSSGNGDSDYRKVNVNFYKKNGGVVLGYNQTGNYYQYTINVPQADDYTVRVAVAADGTGAIVFKVGDGVVSDTLTYEGDSWTKYDEISGKIHLEAGEQILTLEIAKEYIDIDWFEIVRDVCVSGSPECGGTLYVQPVRSGPVLKHYSIFDINGHFIGRISAYTRNDAIRMINGVNHGTYILRDGHNSVTFVK